MNIVRLLRQGSATYLWAAIGAGVVTGLALTILIQMVHRAMVAQPADPVRFLGWYMLVWLAFLVFTTVATIATSAMAHKALYNLRAWVTDHILRLSYRSAEGRGSTFFPVLTEDLQTISYVIYRLPGISTGVATIIGCVGYMVYLSWSVTLIILTLFLLIYVLMTALGRRAQAYARQARARYDDLYRFFEDLVYGLKELKLSPDLRKHYRDVIFPPLVREHQQLKFRENVWFNFSIRSVEILFFPALGVMVYAIFVYGLATPSAFTGILTVLLFILSPLSSLANFVGEYKAMTVSLQRVTALEAEIGANLESAGHQLPLPPPVPGAPMLTLEGVTLEYTRSDGATNFVMGPLDLHIPEGKITFITGDNGSGKSTLAKILTGLYLPESGAIRYAGNRIEPHHLDAYRALFTSVFADFHILRHYPHDPALQPGLNHWLRMMQIDHVVGASFGASTGVSGGKTTGASTGVSGGKTTGASTGESPDARLSQGQRERLALAQACNNNARIMVLDEIASNQDATFKHRIYHEILPALREAGRTIVVISHDPSYFNCADHRVHIHDGRVQPEP